MDKNCRLTVDKSNSIKKIKHTHIYSVGYMNIRERLTMSRPCLHERHSLKETYTNSSKMIKNSKER